MTMDDYETSLLIPTAWWEVIALTENLEWRGLYQGLDRPEITRIYNTVLATWNNEDHRRYVDFRINPPTANWPKRGDVWSLPSAVFNRGKISTLDLSAKSRRIR